MTYRVPQLAVTGADGFDYFTSWGSRLVGVRIVSRYTNEHDECTFIFRNGLPYLDDPAENTPFNVSVGWSTDAMTLTGIFYLARIEYQGTPKEGEQVHYVCRSGLTADLETANSQHFNAENGNKTLSDVFQNLFKGFSVEVAVSPSIAGLPLPGGHLVQWNQSNIDFATDLAEQVGAIIKPMGGKILVLDRNGGQSVGGQSLAAVTVLLTASYRYSAELEPRFQYKSVSSDYFDPEAGRTKDASTPDSGSSGASDALPHPAPDQASASVFAKARADQYKRFSGTAMFEVPGDPNAWAGCNVTAIGYPAAINSIKWLAVEVTHDVVPDTGWITTIETETLAA